MTREAPREDPDPSPARPRSSSSPPPTPSSAAVSPPPLPPAPAPPLPPPPDLAALFPPPTPHRISPIAPPPRQTREQTDEKCWIFTNQSNARRALGLEPEMTMYCYMNFRNSLSSLTPVPGNPHAFLARDAPGPPPDLDLDLDDDDKKTVTIKSARVGDRRVELPSYSWPWLHGRYWYVARGKRAIERHFSEMGHLSRHDRAQDVNAWKMIEQIRVRCREQHERDSSPQAREQRQVKRSLGIVDLNENSESLTSLSSLYSTSLQRLHAHVIRIYSPLWTSLTLLPKTYTDGTQTELLSTIATRLTDGSAFTFAERMVGALKRVSTELNGRRERRDEEARTRSNRPPPPPPVEVGFGGQQPRVPPRHSNGPRLPQTPRPDRPGEEEEEGGGPPKPPRPSSSSSSSSKNEPASERRPPPPYNPGCSIM